MTGIRLYLTCLQKECYLTLKSFYLFKLFPCLGDKLNFLVKQNIDLKTEDMFLNRLNYQMDVMHSIHLIQAIIQGFTWLPLLAPPD